MMRLWRGWGETVAVPPIVADCDTFTSCIDLSRRFMVRIDVDRIENVARALLSEGLGIDHAAMASHMRTVAALGMGSALEIASHALCLTTLQPRPEYLAYPPSRHSPLPIHPHPLLVPVIPSAQRSLIASHQSFLPPPITPNIPPALVITETTALTLAPITLQSTLDERLHVLAVEGGRFLVSDDYVANRGEGVCTYPPDVAPRAAIEAHMAANQRKGKVMILPLLYARDACHAQGLRFHTSNCTVGLKDDAEPPIGRLISDYSHPVGGSMMFDGKKEINRAHFSPIRNPTAADICQLHANAVCAFPGQEIVVARFDIAAANIDGEVSTGVPEWLVECATELWLATGDK